GAGEVAVLAALHRLYPDVRADAPVGDVRHAAADLHLRAGPRLEPVEPVEHHRGADPGAELPDFRHQPRLVVFPGEAGGRQPVGRGGPAVGAYLARPGVT